MVYHISRKRNIQQNTRRTKKLYGGSGAGGDGHTPDGGVGGKGLKNTTIVLIGLT